MQELRTSQEALVAVQGDANMRAMMLTHEEERHARLTADYEALSAQLTQERGRAIEWQTMLMDAQKKLSRTMQEAESERSRCLDLQAQVRVLLPRLNSVNCHLSCYVPC